MKTKVSSIKANFMFNLINQVISFVSPLIVMPYIARIFCADGVGINSYICATVTYFTMFSMLGISGYGQRTIAICRDDIDETSKVFWELQIIHLITFFCTGFVYYFVICNSYQYKQYYLVQIITLLACVADINWFYQAYEKFKLIAIRNCVVKLVSMCMIFLLVREKSDLIIYMVINGVTTLLSNLTLWVGVNKYIHRITIRELRISRHIKDIMIFFIPTIAASVYSVLDKSVINWITHKEEENGYYEQAYKMLMMANVFVQSLSTVLSPRMTNIYADGDLRLFQKMFNQSLNYMMLIATPITFGIISVADTLVPIFLGRGYEKVIILLYIFAPLVVVLGFSVYLDGIYLVPAGKRLQSALTIIAGSVINLFVNIILVIRMESIGAAIATLITETIIAVMMFWLSYKMLNVKELLKEFIKYLSASILMFISVQFATVFLLENFFGLAVEIGIGVVVYVLALIILREKHVLELIRKI